MSQMKKLRLRAGGDLPEATRLLVMTLVLSVLPQRPVGTGSLCVGPLA